MINTVTIHGRATKDPELRRTGTGKAVVSFSIANQRSFGDKQTDFFDCVAWANTAEFIHSYIGKGQEIAITGRLQTRDWEDRNGNKRKSVEIVVSEVDFCGSKPKEDNDTKYPEGVRFTTFDDEPEENLPF